MVEALIAAGARVHRITNSGRTARDAARMNGHHSLLRVLRSPVARARWGRAIACVRVVTAFLAAGRSKLLREADAIFSAAYGGAIIKVPEEFVCPITMELFKDPVVAADGFTYERRAIERHLKTARARSTQDQPSARAQYARSEHQPGFHGQS